MDREETLTSTIISFSDPKSSFYVSGSPSENLDVAQQNQKLRLVQIGETEGQNFYNEFKQFIMLCHDDVCIQNGGIGAIGKASKKEFFDGEEIIDSIIRGVNPKWNTKQILAFVHYKMGELISYIPDFNYRGKYVNNKEANNARNIWKSLVQGESVCNGITRIQRTIFSRLGIKTRELSSGTHSFLLTETKDGNIITDATWDLAASLYGARPSHFGVTYEELQEEDGQLSHAHKLESPPENVIKIDDKELREIFHGIGLTNEDRTFKFPILSIVQEVEAMGLEQPKERMRAFLKKFTQNFRREATHLLETRSILEQCLGELGVQNLTTKFVYDIQDEEYSNPKLVLHVGSEEQKGEIRILNLDKIQFDTLNIESFDKQYRVHEEDSTEPFWKKYITIKEQQTEKEEQTQG